jgi:hypothetical protein
MLGDGLNKVLVGGGSELQAETGRVSAAVAPVYRTKTSIRTCRGRTGEEIPQRNRTEARTSFRGRNGADTRSSLQEIIKDIPFSHLHMPTKRVNYQAYWQKPTTL